MNNKKKEGEMKKIWIITLVLVLLLGMSFSYAGDKSSSNILKQGVLGAGAGAVGGAASGAKGRDLWKGALAGAGVNIVGGALLDSMSGEKVRDADDVRRMDAQDAYSSGYGDGFNNGYKKGFTEGYKEGVKEGAGTP
tara:strand:- start:2 stop:412 length:411 start_codon:yes stop_codon:yes gene_type:complete